MPLIIASLLLLLVSFVDDVSWLADVQRTPANSPTPARELAPLMSDTEYRAANALELWKSRRLELVQSWNNVLGPSPESPKVLAIEVLETEELKKVTRKRVRYENEPGQFLEAYILEPRGINGSLPGIVALHATTDKTNQPIAGVGGRDDEQLGLKLAEQGFVVICPENFLWLEAANYNDAVAQFHKRYPHSLGMRKMLYDAMRATDILVSLPNVDSKRIGAVGHSLGAKEVLYLTAFDERISASVFSEGGLEFESTNWDAPWYLGPVVKDKNFPRNHHELVALIAPRPFLVLGGESGPGAADGDRSWPYLVASRPIYELYGLAPKFGLYNHHEGHSISPRSFERIADWLNSYLK